MGRVNWAGALIIVILFIILSVFVASKITVADASISIPGMPTDTQPVSLLHAIWTNFVDWLQEIW